MSVWPIIRGSNVLHSIGVRGKLITFPEPGPLRVIGIVNRNSLAAVFLHHRKTRHIGGTISNVNHVWKRDRANLGIHVVVHVLRHVEQSLVDPKQELRLLSMTDHAFGKSDSPLFILGKFAAENCADVRRETAAVDQNLHSGRDDVVLDANSVSKMLGREQSVTKLLKHFGQAFVESQLLAELFEFGIGWPVHPEGIEKHFHVSELIVVTMLTHEITAPFPKLWAVNTEHREDDVVLHIIGAKGLIVVVYDGDGVLRRRHFGNRFSGARI